MADINEVNKIAANIRVGHEDLLADAAQVESIWSALIDSLNNKAKQLGGIGGFGSEQAQIESAKVVAIQEKTEAQKTAILQRSEAQREAILLKANASAEGQMSKDIAVAEKASAEKVAIEEESAAKIEAIKSKNSVTDAKALKEIETADKVAAQKVAIEQQAQAKIDAIKAKASISEGKGLQEINKAEAIEAKRVAIEEESAAKIEAIRSKTAAANDAIAGRDLAVIEKTESQKAVIEEMGAAAVNKMNAQKEAIEQVSAAKSATIEEESATKRVSIEEVASARIQAIAEKTNAQKLSMEELTAARIQAIQNNANHNMEHGNDTMLGHLQGSIMHHLGFMAAGGVIMGLGMPAYEGLVGMEKGMAGVEQVLPQLEKDQGLLNQVSNDYIDIMKRYGASLNDVTDAAKLWGRQYKDIQMVQNLVNATSLLSIVDNLNLADANKALEATMNQYGMTARNAGEAQAYSMRIVDSWTNVAHNAQVSVNDLAAANERSASVAHKVGVEYDYLQGMITAAVRATGQPGANIGNMLKSVFGSIHSKDAVKEIEALGVKMKQVGSDGKQYWRPVQDVITDVIFATRGAKMDTEELTKSMAGGKFQWAKLAAMMGDFDTMVKATALSINSQGATLKYAAVQMDTIDRKAKQLHATLIGLFSEGGNDGLRTTIKGLLDWLNQFIMGMSKIDPFYAKLAGMGVVGWGLVSVWKSMFTTLEPLVAGMKAATIATEATTAAEVAETATTVAATGAMGGLAIVTGIATGGLALLIGGLAAWAYKSGEAEKKQLDLNQAFQDQVAINQQKAAQYQQEADFLKNAEGYREKLIAKLNDEKLSSQALAKTKQDLAAVEDSIKIVIGQEAWAHVQATKDKKQAMQEEIDKLDELAKKKKTAMVDSVKDQITETQNTIDQITKRVEAYQTELQVKTALATGMIAMPSHKQSIPLPQLDPNTPKTYDHSNVLSQGYKEGDYHPLVADVDGISKKIKSEESKIPGLKSQVDSLKQKLMNIVTTNNFNPDSNTTSVAGDSGTKVTDFTEPYKQMVTDIEDSLSSVNDRTQVTDQYLAKLKAQNDVLTNSFDQNGHSVKTLNQIYANNQEQSRALTVHQQNLSAENLVYGAQIDKVKKQIDILDVAEQKGQVTKKNHRLAVKVLSDEEKRLEKSINDNVVANYSDIKSISDLKKASNDLTKSVYDDSIKWIESQKSLGKMDANDVLAALQKLKQKYKENYDVQSDIIQKLRDAEKARYDESTQWLNNQKALGKLTDEEVNQALARMKTKYANIDPSVAQDIATQQYQMAEKAEQRHQSKLDEIVSDASRTRSEKEKQLDNALQGGSGTIEYVSAKWKLYGYEMQSNTTEMQQVSAEIERLKTKLLSLKDSQSIDDTTKRITDLTNTLQDLKDSSAELQQQRVQLVSDTLKSGYQFAYDKEKESIQKLIDAENKRHDTFAANKQAEIDKAQRQWDAEDYQTTVDDKASQRSDLEKQLKTLKLDDSQIAAKKRKDLQTKLDDLDKNIADDKKKHDRDLEKQQLQDQITADEKSRDTTLAGYQKDLDAADAKYKDLLDENHVYNEALKLAATTNQDEILTILQNKIPEYFARGKSMSEQFLAGWQATDLSAITGQQGTNTQAASSQTTATSTAQQGASGKTNIGTAYASPTAQQAIQPKGSTAAVTHANDNPGPASGGSDGKGDTGFFVKNKQVFTRASDGKDYYVRDEKSYDTGLMHYHSGGINLKGSEELAVILPNETVLPQDLSKAFWSLANKAQSNMNGNDGNSQKVIKIDAGIKIDNLTIRNEADFNTLDRKFAQQNDKIKKALGVK